MKLWEILKEENIGKKKYRDNNNKEYILIMKDENYELYYKGRLANFTQYEIMNLDFEEIESSNINGWERVPTGEAYYYIDKINDKVDDYYEENDISDEILYDSCNYFSTREKAEEVAKEQLLYRKMKKFYDENDGQVNWNDLNAFKYDIYYDYCQGKWDTSYIFMSKNINTIYFSTEELAQKCIDEVVIPFFKEK